MVNFQQVSRIENQSNHDYHNQNNRCVWKGDSGIKATVGSGISETRPSGHHGYLDHVIGIFDAEGAQVG